jgi:queuine/archaeosine tRNA-ribosyltransferase
MFYRELPEALRERALGVVHGRTLAQVEYCLDRYVRVGLRHVGFGSFGTAGQNSSMNIATTSAVDNARRLATLAAERGLTTHLFGVGAPAILPWIAGTGATSFDSANWARSAGFGQVFLPLTRGFNVSHRSTLSSIQRGLTRDQFDVLRAASGHTCSYCESFEALQVSREARAGHNLYATTDELDIIRRGDTRRMDAIYQTASPKYRARWQRWREQL